MTETVSPSEWITTGEAAELTGYSTFHIRRLIQGGKITGKKYGRDWLVCRDSVQSYIDEMKVLGSAKHNPRRNNTE